MVSDLRDVDFVSFHIKPTMADETWEWILKKFCEEHNKYRAVDNQLTLNQFKDRVLTADGFISCANLGFVRVSNGDRYESNIQPTFEDNMVNVPGRDGAYYFGSTYSTRDIIIQIAYDGLTEMQLRAIGLIFSADKKMWDIYFDERPYKVYHVKISQPVSLKYICMDEHIPEGNLFLTAYGADTQVTTDASCKLVHNHMLTAGVSNYSSGLERIYKGEGTFTIKAITPFATERYKYLEDYSESNRDEWATSSRLMASKAYNGAPHKVNDHTLYLLSSQPGSYAEAVHEIRIKDTIFIEYNNHALEIDNVDEYDTWKRGNCLAYNAGDLDAHWSETIPYTPCTDTTDFYLSSSAKGLDSYSTYYVTETDTEGKLTDRMREMTAEERAVAPGKPTGGEQLQYYTRDASSGDGLKFDNTYGNIFEYDVIEIIDEEADTADYEIAKIISFDIDFPNKTTTREKENGKLVSQNMYISGTHKEQAYYSRYWSAIVTTPGTYSYRLVNKSDGRMFESPEGEKFYNAGDVICSYKFDYVYDTKQYGLEFDHIYTTSSSEDYPYYGPNKILYKGYSTNSSEADKWRRSWSVYLIKRSDPVTEEISGYIATPDSIPQEDKSYYTINEPTNGYFYMSGSEYIKIDFKSTEFLIKKDTVDPETGSIVSTSSSDENDTLESVWHIYKYNADNSKYELISKYYKKISSTSYEEADDLAVTDISVYYYTLSDASYFESDPATSEGGTGTQYYVFSSSGSYVPSYDLYPQSGIIYYLKSQTSDTYMNFEIEKFPLENEDGTKNYLKVEKLKKANDSDVYLKVSSKSNLIEGVNSLLNKTGTVYNKYKTEGIFFLLGRGESQIKMRAIDSNGVKTRLNPPSKDKKYVVNDKNLVIDSTLTSVKVEDDNLVAESDSGWTVYNKNVTVDTLEQITDLNSSFRYF